jgi:starch-binding outer membrane protein, SusD/RagB family
MRYSTRMRSGGARRPGRRAITAAAALLLPLGACDIDRILEVEDPDVTGIEALTDPENLPLVRAMAIGDFGVGFSGQGFNTPGLVQTVGLFTDEFYHAGTFGTRREVDKRAITEENSELLIVFRNVHRGRRSAEFAREQYAQHGPGSSGHAEMANLAGYSYVFFAENYCSGVPFSRLLPDGSVDFGQPQTRQQMLASAEGFFDEALQMTGGTDRQAQLARVGKARVLLNRGDYEAAAAMAAPVLTGFAYQVEHSDNSQRQWNGTWMLTHGTRRYGIAHHEGGNGLPFRGDDPRVPWLLSAQRAIDAPFAHFFQRKFTDPTDPVVVASGIEARLIEAEAALNAGVGGIASFVSIHNELRSLEDDLEPLDLVAVSAMTQGQRVDLHFRERAFWLYLTGHRLADMRRLVRQYGRDAEGSVFPSGTYSRLLFGTLEPRVDGTYGTDVNLPVPFDERNNPNFQGCLDRAA